MKAPLPTSLQHMLDFHTNRFHSFPGVHPKSVMVECISELTYFAEKFGRPKPTYSLPNAPVTVQQVDGCERVCTVGII